MPDPLADARSGYISPFVNNRETVNEVLRTARAARAGQFGPRPFEDKPADEPAQLIAWGLNRTTTDFPALSVVKLGDASTYLSAVEAPYAVRRRPVFTITTPDATTNTFGILLEPCSYNQAARLATLGVMPVDVEITDAAHTFAVPINGTYSKLTSATSGPARIISRESGTGTKRAVVLVTEDTASASSGLTSGYSYQTTSSVSIAADGPTEYDLDTEITLPESGEYLVSFQIPYSILVTAAPSNGRLTFWVYDVTDSVQLVPDTLSGSVSWPSHRTQVINIYTDGTTVATFSVTTTAAKTIKLKASRSAGPTYSVCTVQRCRLDYLKIA